MASATEKLHFKFYSISLKLDFHTHVWPTAATVEGAAESVRLSRTSGSLHTT